MVAAVFTSLSAVVLCFHSRHEISGKLSWEICHEQWLKEDLTDLRSNGVPLWDGKARLRSRHAGETEAELYRQAAQAQEGPSRDDMLLVYLVELDIIEDVTAA